MAALHSLQRQGSGQAAGSGGPETTIPACSCMSPPMLASQGSSLFSASRPLFSAARLGDHDRTGDQMPGQIRGMRMSGQPHPCSPWDASAVNHHSAMYIYSRCLASLWHILPAHHQHLQSLVFPYSSRSRSASTAFFPAPSFRLPCHSQSHLVSAKLTRSSLTIIISLALEPTKENSHSL